jgi:hypothetical protein
MWRLMWKLNNFESYPFAMLSNGAFGGTQCNALELIFPGHIVPQFEYFKSSRSCLSYVVLSRSEGSKASSRQQYIFLPLARFWHSPATRIVLGNCPALVSLYSKWWTSTSPRKSSITTSKGPRKARFPLEMRPESVVVRAAERASPKMNFPTGLTLWMLDGSVMIAIFLIALD